MDILNTYFSVAGPLALLGLAVNAAAPSVIAYRNGISLSECRRIALMSLIPTNSPKAYRAAYSLVVEKAGKTLSPEAQRELEQFEVRHDEEAGPARWVWGGLLKGLPLISIVLIVLLAYPLIGPSSIPAFERSWSQKLNGLLLIWLIFIPSFRAGYQACLPVRNAVAQYLVFGHPLIVVLARAASSGFLALLEFVVGMAAAPLYAITYAYKVNGFVRTVREGLESL